AGVGITTPFETIAVRCSTWNIVRSGNGIERRRSWQGVAELRCRWDGTVAQLASSTVFSAPFIVILLGLMSASDIFPPGSPRWYIGGWLCDQGINRNEYM